MIKRFNSGAVWLVTGVSGTVGFAAVVLAVQDHYTRKADCTKEAVPAGSAIAKTSSQEVPSSLLESAASTPAPVLTLTPKLNGYAVTAKAAAWTPAKRQATARATGSPSPRSRPRSPGRPGFVDEKARLIALWHQSLIRGERSHTWTSSSNLKGARKKISYTAEIKN